jgi:hypothetical protein
MNSVPTSLETHYFPDAHLRIQFVPHWKHTTSLLAFKNPVPTSLETHYFPDAHLRIQFIPHWKHTTSLLYI